MIKEITLKNYKSFLNKTIDFSPLTILTGLNGSGKSSVIQAIRMIQRSCGDGFGNPKLDDHVLPNQLKSKLTKDDYFILELKKNNKSYSTHVNEIETESYSFDADNGKCKRELAYISYLSADRYGPKNQLPGGNLKNIFDVGNMGENVIAFLDKYQYQKVPEAIRLKQTEETLFDNTNSWLSIISKITLLRYEPNKSKSYDLFYNGIVPSETGYGLSFTLPVIVSLLFSDEHDSERTLMIENPEAHLHPSAQTELGKLIALSIATGKQVIIETHSDHIIDGIRITAKQEKIRASDVKFHFFRRDSFEEETKIETPQLYQDGKLSFWPKGFFDQGLKDMEDLLD